MANKTMTYVARPKLKRDNKVIVSRTMTGKMEGVHGISTSNVENKICQWRKSCKDSICQNCFAEGIMNQYDSAHLNSVYNLELLSSRLLDDSELPTLVEDIFRIESFGDVSNVIHARNYLRIIRKNSLTMFGWWSKNMHLVSAAIKAEGFIPENVNFIQSSMFVNCKDEAKYDFVVATFTVYDDFMIEVEGIDINCGARSCRGCMKCYTKMNRVNGEAVEIREQLK